MDACASVGDPGDAAVEGGNAGGVVADAGGD